MTECCEFLEWDSAFFGFPVARLRTHLLNAELAERCIAWCLRHGIRCLYFLAACDDIETTDTAARFGFRLVDIRMTLEHDLRVARRSSPAIRPCREEDVGILRRIAAETHQDSRFYHDTHFPRERCDELYATWIERSFRGYADAVLVAERDGTPAGYVTCHLDPAAVGRIGLLGVSAEARGQGVGGELVEAALAYFCEHGMTRATVVTQGRNVAAQRLYQKHGFRTRSVEFWYHKWFDAPEGQSAL
jgi:dTDP-4-amino-4,6-dideoxy-D-galactose acyltransferase